MAKPKKQLSLLENPRVRFAPAPTGYLHVGGARTILFNWLFARKHGGSFVLRIEDTDVERSRPEFEKDILESMRWLGLDWDEGPDIGGEYGPYRQSERIEIYHRYLEKLLREGHAYRCYCLKEDLEAERQEMISRGASPKYSGRCRSLTESQIKAYEEEGRGYVIRIKMPEKKVAFDDLAHGKIEFDMGLTGDISIARDERSPLFNFAVVVDDFEMKISHVIRGDEHISNTPKQIVIQEMLGLPQPIYAHIPLLLGPDRSKLSKRHGAEPIKNYREAGYLPEAMLNFLVLLGWHPAGDKEIFSKEELIQEFSLDRVQKGGAIFNQKRFDWLNAHYLRTKSAKELASEARDFLIKSGVIKGSTNLPAGYLEAIIELEKERIQKLSDLAGLTDFFFEKPKFDPALLVWKEMSLNDVLISLQKIEEALGKMGEGEFKKEKIDMALAPFYGRDKGEILWPFRVALTGRRASPGPFEIAEILGKEEVLVRVRYAEKLLERI